jgi:hypothetical protein
MLQLVSNLAKRTTRDSNKVCKIWWIETVEPFRDVIWRRAGGFANLFAQSAILRKPVLWQ